MYVNESVSTSGSPFSVMVLLFFVLAFIIVVLFLLILSPTCVDTVFNSSAFFLPDEGDLTNNLALRKPTSQSSQFRDARPNRAVDGNRNSYLDARSCTHTLDRKGSWWQVDLGAVYEIRDVVITNRGDCCGKLKHT